MLTAPQNRWKVAVQMLLLLLLKIYTVSKKTRHLIFYHNVGKCEPIFKILSQTYSDIRKKIL